MMKLKRERYPELWKLLEKHDAKLLEMKFTVSPKK